MSSKVLVKGSAARVLVKSGVTGSKATGSQFTNRQIRSSIRQQISADAFIPAELLSKIGDEFSRTGAYSAGSAKNIELSRGRTGVSGSGVYKDFTSEDKAAEYVAESVFAIRNTYYAFYVALIRSMDKLLQEPGITAEGGGYARSVSVRRNVPLYVVGIRRAPTRFTAKIAKTWPGLSSVTMEEKDLPGRFKSFWKHSGQASQAFSAMASARVARVRPQDFMVVDRSAIQVLGGVANIKGRGKFVRQARITVQMGVPLWNRQMDALITIPFSTRKTVSTLTTTGLTSLRRGNPGVFKGRNLTGVDRLLAAEAYRPWLRELSIQAGEQLLAYLSGTTVTARNSALAGELADQAARNKPPKRLRKKVTAVNESYRLLV